MYHRLRRLPGTLPKCGALRIGDRDQGHLHNLGVRDTQQVRGFLFIIEVKDGPQVPRPRARAASMKLQAAGMIEPYMACCNAVGSP